MVILLIFVQFSGKDFVLLLAVSGGAMGNRRICDHFSWNGNSDREDFVTLFLKFTLLLR